MKTKLLFLAAFFISIITQSQTLKSNHAFAIGSPNSVNIIWDAFGETTVQGCLVYKQRNQFQPIQLITPEMIVSVDSLYSFTDEGEFDSILPPEYTIYAITNVDTVLINSCSGFKSIDFEVINPTHINMVLVPWNPMECCASVKVFQNDLYLVETGYEENFQATIDPGLLSPGDYYRYMLMSAAPELYAQITITWEFLQHLILTMGIEDNSTTVVLDQNQPNPFSSETTIRFELKQKCDVLLDVYSLEGRKVKSLINQSLNSGLHVVTFTKGDIQSGVYIYRLRTSTGVSNRRMIIQ